MDVCTTTSGFFGNYTKIIRPEFLLYRKKFLIYQKLFIIQKITFFCVLSMNSLKITQKLSLLFQLCMVSKRREFFIEQKQTTVKL
jgi:hypothetical protein